MSSLLDILPSKGLHKVYVYVLLPFAGFSVDALPV